MSIRCVASDYPPDAYSGRVLYLIMKVSQHIPRLPRDSLRHSNPTPTKLSPSFTRDPVSSPPRRPPLTLIVQSEWFRDALLDLPPTSTRITLVATPATNDAPDQAQGGSATVSSNNRRANRTKVGSFSIQAEGDFGSTEVSWFHRSPLLATQKLERGYSCTRAQSSPA